MRTVVIQLVGGPWDGQTLSTSSPDEANACFAHALYAISGGRKGTRIPLMPPGMKKKSAKKPHLARPAPRAHDYEIASSEQEADELVIVARHISVGRTSWSVHLSLINPGMHALERTWRSVLREL